MKKITNGFEETQNAGEEFAKELVGGDAVLLFGNLGAGKTTFMQGVAKGLGIAKRITSPTFLIVRRYEVNNSKGIERLYHIDLYRTQTENDLKGLGISEIFEDENATIAIEWSEKLENFFPKRGWKITFETINENIRSIDIKKIDQRMYG